MEENLVSFQKKIICGCLRDWGCEPILFELRGCGKKFQEIVGRFRIPLEKTYFNLHNPRGKYVSEE